MYVNHLEVTDPNSRSIAIDYLNSRFASEYVKVVYIYFDYTIHRTQTAAHVTTSLLKQLLSQCDQLPAGLDSLYALYDESLRTSTRPDLSTFTQLLILCAQEFSIYAVFDAMDECNEDYQADIISLFIDLQKSSCKLLISSRPHLRNLLFEIKCTRLLEVCAEESDLRAYILTRLEQKRNRCVELKHRSLQLAKSADGM